MSRAPDQHCPRQHSLDRRLFLTAAGGMAGAAALTALGAAPQAAQAALAPSEKLTVGIMGVNGRGSALAKGFLGQQANIAYICDVDVRALDKVVAMVAAGQANKPQAVSDFRKILDDPSVDALVVSAPNHWHAPATILGCAAGKHVYVEKPCSQTAREGEMAVEASRKHKRVVQMGSQRRTWPALVEGIGKIHAGEIGKVHYARTWYNNRRPSVGQGKVVAVPEWLNWKMWQGPAPAKDFKDNIVHYNWHWHWHWGNGELGNNGVHALDVARWGMDVDYPTRVVSGGGKYRWEDDQETADTHIVTYNFPDEKSIMWEGLSWSPYGPGGSKFGISFHGDEGTLVILDSGYKIYNMQNIEQSAVTGDGGEAGHIANFLDCTRTGKLPNADIAEGHQSTLLCHLGNIALRTNRVLTTDPKNGHILNDEDAMQLWTREYQPGWEPKV